MKVGDTVAIRGDLQVHYYPWCGWRCRYSPEQLVLGKYVKHTGHGGIWLGVVEKIAGDMALVGGAWRGVEMYEVIAGKIVGD